MNVARLRGLAPVTIALAIAFIVSLVPAGRPASAAAELKVRAARRVMTSVTRSMAEAAQAPLPVIAEPLAAPSAPPTPVASAAPMVVSVEQQATATPRPTLSGTMPPATVPPTPSPSAPTTPTPIPATQFARVFEGKNAAIRTSPSTSASVVIKVPKGQIAGLLAITASGNWYKATFRGKTGYVPVSRMQRINLVGRTLATQYPRVIVVARQQQHMEVWDNGRLMIISAVTTGRPELPTPLGTTQVMKKESPHLFQSPWNWPSIYWYPPGWADYAVLFRSGGFYFHDTHARPQNGYGIGTNVPHIDPDGVQRTGSRGCANTPYWAVRMLYGWARYSDPVVVLDA